MDGEKDVGRRVVGGVDTHGGVAKLVGIGGGVVSGCFNPNESSVDAPDQETTP